LIEISKICQQPWSIVQVHFYQQQLVIISLMIFPLFCFISYEMEKSLNQYVTNMLPNAWRNDTSTVLTQVNLQLSSYVRGQLIVAATVAIMFSIMFSIIGLKYAVVIGIVAGFLNLIPYLGRSWQ
jgi:predicted PurR-regulated permease PerM